MDSPQDNLVVEHLCAGSSRRMPGRGLTLPASTAGWLAPARCFDPNFPEMIDRPGTDRALVREELQALERANDLLGGHRLVLECVQRLLGSTQVNSVRVLDLATGAADIPRALVAWARQRHLPITVTAVDRNPEALAMAQEACRGWPEIRLEQHDLAALP
jgi:hypothetical protein